MIAGKALDCTEVRGSSHACGFGTPRSFLPPRSRYLVPPYNRSSRARLQNGQAARDHGRDLRSTSHDAAFVARTLLFSGRNPTERS